MKIKSLMFVLALTLLTARAYGEDLLEDVSEEEKTVVSETTTVTELAATDPAINALIDPASGNADTPAMPLPRTTESTGSWEYPPVVQISKWGQELRIIVEPNVLMDREKIPAIESVRLETEKGEFLGLKTYGPQEVKRRAEFMLDPLIMKIDKVKIIVHSQVDGDWTVVAPLKETSGDEVTAYTVDPELQEEQAAVETPAATPVPPAEEPKKKKRGWFW